MDELAQSSIKIVATQLNYTVFCASSACGVSLAHLNYTKHSMIRSRLLSREASSEKITDSIATRDLF